MLKGRKIDSGLTVIHTSKKELGHICSHRDLTDSLATAAVYAAEDYILEHSQLNVSYMKMRLDVECHRCMAEKEEEKREWWPNSYKQWRLEQAEKAIEQYYMTYDASRPDHLSACAKWKRKPCSCGRAAATRALGVYRTRELAKNRRAE